MQQMDGPLVAPKQNSSQKVMNEYLSIIHLLQFPSTKKRAAILIN